GSGNLLWVPYSPTSTGAVVERRFLMTSVSGTRCAALTGAGAVAECDVSLAAVVSARVATVESAVGALCSACGVGDLQRLIRSVRARPSMQEDIIFNVLFICFYLFLW